MRNFQMAGGLSRRGLIVTAGAGLVAAPSAFAAQAHKPAARAAAPAGHTAAGAPPSPEQAMTRLMAGNGRYVAAKATHPNGDAARRRLVAAGQTPFATILACADSRVAPELIFDQGLGDLFVVRVAGNVVDDAILASIEYSVIHLGSNLVMALGHERCGAVKATADALDGHGSPEDADTKIGALAALIAPAVRAVPAGTVDRVDAAVSLNAAQAAAEIFAGSRPLRARVLAGQLKIVAARYDLDDGKVSPAKGRSDIV
ncbi:carbonic anhydrase [Phenylobacterium sp. J367]|uniref:carbonic anhydrase n=1 Tax=Phenylobacterium sp. J367 TaxID=2898435 RepID=UPI002151585B|nr:carbonic anhydrase [Phenylobacterium sp. J367]MCR5878765.1 carbonic anhydrase [Phenylobacterium sp. J367]